MNKEAILAEADAIDAGLTALGDDFAGGQVPAAKLVKQTEVLNKHTAKIRALVSDAEPEPTGKAKAGAPPDKTPTTT